MVKARSIYTCYTHTPGIVPWSGYPHCVSSIYGNFPSVHISTSFYVWYWHSEKEDIFVPVCDSNSYVMLVDTVNGFSINSKDVCK